MDCQALKFRRDSSQMKRLFRRGFICRSTFILDCASFYNPAVAHSVRLCLFEHHSSLIVLLTPTPFTLHCPCPYPIHLDIAVAHSSLIVLLTPNTSILDYPSLPIKKRDIAVAHSSLIVLLSPTLL